MSDKGGLSGLAIKAGYGVVKGVKPSFIRDAVDRLLDPFAEKLDPFYQGAKTSGTPIVDAFKKDAQRAAEALLEITDERAKRPGQTGVVAKTYDKLRPSAKEHVVSAMTRLGKLVEKYDA